MLITYHKENIMKTLRLLIPAALMICLSAAYATSGDKKEMNAGKDLFLKHCAACHPEGGNIINPQKTLHKKDRAANKITSAKDIIGKMRNPGPGMTPFDNKTVSDKEAKEIAEYILKSF
jgi:cytochrome c6